MKNATFSKGFLAFLCTVLAGVVFALLFNTPRTTEAATQDDAKAAMDGGYAAIEPANAPPVIEARPLSDKDMAESDASASAAPDSANASASANAT